MINIYLYIKHINIQFSIKNNNKIKNSRVNLKRLHKDFGELLYSSEKNTKDNRVKDHYVVYDVLKDNEDSLFNFNIYYNNKRT